MQRWLSGLRKWVIFPVTEMSFQWWKRGPNKTIFSVARVNDAIQPRVPWQRARHLPLGHIFHRGVTPCLITQPGWLSPVASTIVHVCNTLSFWVRARVCVHACQTERFLKHHLQAFLTRDPETTTANKTRLSILARGNGSCSRRLPNKGKPLIFPKLSRFNCLYLLREINFKREEMQMCMNKLLDKPISQFNSWEMFL